ncbi:MAG: hypothetical protein GY708_02985, partial [Actinomycetia bacterium]|nr:hypothetical protein [Actinomycetes bacterium]
KGQSRPERHKTLAAAIDWSTEGLDDNALILLRRLGYFVGGFTLDAAEQVCRFGSIGSVDVVDLLDDLARRYLVMPAMAGDTSRFRILEPIRQLVVAQLSEAEADEVAGRHARWCAARANELQELLLSPDEASAYPEVRVELPNFRVAHRWALEFEPDMAAELVEGLLSYMFTRLHLEIADWYDRTLEVLDPDDPWYHRCLAGAVGAWTLRRRYQEVTAARDTIDQSAVPIWVMDNAKLMFALRDEATTGSLDAYDRLASEALENDDPFTATLALCWALRTDETLAVAEAAGIPSAIAHATYHSSIAALRHGDETKALGELARAIDQTRAIDMDLVLSRSLVMWAALAIRLGEDRSIAMAAAEEGREMLIRSGIPQGREGHLALAELFGTEKDVGALERWQQTRRSTFS